LRLYRLRAEAETEAEVPMRGRLRGLREGGDDQRMARVDRHDERPDTESGYRRTD
jgi:hypothetical protein